MSAHPILAPACLLAALGLHGTACASPALGQIDTFQDGTAAGWGNGLAADPANIAGGGPAGAADRFLQISANGAGQGGKLTVFNRAQWAGDFTLQGVGRVEMDLRNPNSTALSVRIGLKANTGAGSAGYASDAFALPADNQWHHARFALDAGSLTAIGSPAPLAALLANVAEFRILHSPAPALNGSDFAGLLHIDNIQAGSPVPLPTPAWLFGSALAGLAGWRKTRRTPHRH